MAEIGALLRRYTVNHRIEGSNPSVSASTKTSNLLNRPRGSFRPRNTWGLLLGLLTAYSGISLVKVSQTPIVSKPRDFFGLGSEP